MKWWEWLIPGYSQVKAQGEAFEWLGNAFNGLTGKTSAEATKTANEQNIAYQDRVNAQQQYNLEHAHQIEAADLQAAGLNPWLSVGGGAQQANLQTAQVEPEDGSKMLQATTALMLMLALKLATPAKAPGSTSPWKIRLK